MRSVLVVRALIAAAVFWSVHPDAIRAEEVPAECRAAVDKGLEWLAHTQHQDGHWDVPGNRSPVAMTALAGMALLMEGSTICEGKYHDNIRRATDWLMQQSQTNGLIYANDNSGYMYGQGYAMLFLSSVAGEEENADRRSKLVDILERAAKFSRLAQSSRGGWYYTSAKESGDRDEGSVTVSQLQGLRAARNAGIAVPAEVIQDGIKYLRNATCSDGGIIYSLSHRGSGDSGRLAITAAGIACGFSTGEYDSPLVKQWLRFCRDRLSLSLGSSRIGHDEYTYYYYSQAIYLLGEDRWAKLFPDDKGGGLTWSVFRKGFFAALVQRQEADGSWSGGQVGPVFVTAINLSILQLDKAVLPIYQR